MILYFICCLAAILASGLTFFSGFGLGTILTPIFALFFPIEIAIASTAIVHFTNNIFKFAITHKNIDNSLLISFGLPSFFAALVGALLLNTLVGFEAFYSYTLFKKVIEITPLKLGIGLVIIFFTWFENIKKNTTEASKKNMFFGGLLSGFCGGLSGNQGALRSMFLNSLKLNKETFIATGIAIACLTDVARLSIYIKNIDVAKNNIDFPLVTTVTIFAIAGACFGNKLLQKTTLKMLNKIVMLMLFAIGFAMCVGLV